MKKYEYWLVSMEAFGAGLATRRKLKDTFYDARGVYKAKADELRKVDGIKEEVIEEIIKHRLSEEELENNYRRLLKSGVRLICEEDDDYPHRLKPIKNRPDVLFVKGRLPDENKLTVSIVGSRHASAYGIKVTEYFTEGLVKKDVQIVSGMAYGIDSCAHKISLEAGADTFAVMGCGIDICYPAEKIELYEKIKRSGGIISEFPPKIPPLAYRFPMRNRIIAGLSDIVIVVEARKKSGSLITANHALEQGKDVYVVPGRIDDLNSEGCNMLWFDGAIPALNLETILEGAAFKKLLYIEETPSLNSDEKIMQDEKIILASKNDIVYSCLDLHPKGVEEIVKRTTISPEEVTLSLVEMQLEGKVEEVYRGFYIRKNRN